jgi:tetratricopeptide (TPR) repeat protein
VRIHLRLGEIRTLRGDLHGAISAYEHARALAPGSVEPYLQLGQLLFRAGKPGQALYELGRALEMGPNNLDVRYHLYQVYQQSGMQQEALTQLRLLKAGEEGAAIAGLFLRHAREQMRRGELDAAAGDYRLSLELLPDQEEAIWSLGDILYRQGQLVEALRVWGRGLWVSLSPALDERLAALAQAGLGGEVEAVYRRAAVLHPRAGRLAMVLGDLAEARGDNPEAVRLWEEAVATQPALVEAHLRLEKQCDAAGEPERARRHLRAALMALWGREVVLRCRACGHVTAIEQPYCFACGAWDTLAPLSRADLEPSTALIPAVLAQRVEGWWSRVRGWLLGPGPGGDGETR